MATRFLMAIPILAIALAPPLARAQELLPQPAQPNDYALTNVRIVSAPGRVIDRGTVLIRNGRIAAVGAQVTIPAGVARLDLTGQSVYPGLIDAATSIGLPSTNRAPANAPPAADAAAGRGGRGGRGGGAAPAPAATGRAAGTPAPVIYPEIDAAAEAAEMFAPTPEELEAFRAGGVTTVGLVFQGGLFPGRVGAALTGGQNEQRLVLRMTVGQDVSFGTLRGGYPSTGIGAVAYVRQAIIDGQYEAMLDKAAKAGNPNALPSYDPMPRALMSAAAGDIPFWFVASQERPIGRVGDIAKELKLKSPVVVGAQEGWKSATMLKEIGATAVVSLSAGGGRGGGRGGGGGGGRGGAGAAAPGGAAVPMVDPRTNASTLAKAGIPVAFASYGGTSGAAFRESIRSAIDGGMTADDALRAATIVPATLLGISNVVGTIDTGKLANLVVVTGNDLFATGAVVRHVFVQGRLYSMEAAVPAPGRSGGPGGDGSGVRAPHSTRGS
jgi:imidazolonepropionase-like amidohydrolase